MSEFVWAIHNFEAEAEDEISFHIGEPIVVHQKDELYQDGWWEGTNVRGQTGLFPMNYTVQDDPSLQPPLEGKLPSNSNSNNNNNNNLSNGSHPNTNIHHNHNSASNNTNNTSNSNSNSNSNNNANNYGSSANNAKPHSSNLNHLHNNLNNMHINQNPMIASPTMSAVRGFSSNTNSISSSATPNSKLIAQTVEESLNDPELQGHPATWSIDQVAYWLRWCGFGTVVGSFIDNEISGAILLELNLNNLKELDITSFGKRFNIMNAITSLKQTTKGGSKSQYGALTNSIGSMFSANAGHLNIPPRMTSAPIDPTPRASYDPRNEYTRNQHDLHDPRSAPMAPSIIQSPPMRQQQQQQQQQLLHPDYDLHSNQSQSRSNALARSDTVGSLMSGGSAGDHNGHSVDARGGQRQSVTSAYSSNSNPRNQWDRSAPRPPQMPSPVVPQQPPMPPPQQQPPQQHQQQQQQRGPVNDFEDRSFDERPVEQPMDQYPRPMDRNGPMSPKVLHEDPYSPEQYQRPVPQQRKSHNPDSNNRQMNGKADPSDKVVSLDLIGKPDYAGWLKKRGDTYRTWKSRWFMLKGVTLYYMNSPKDNASKDYINLIGYKIIQDENIYAGKYCFKAVHDELRNFYFYTESETDMKGWLKALMKVTIGRDPTAPVISSSNIPTIPLHVARRMAPRPPSPSKRTRALGPNGQPMHPHQQQQQQQFEQKLPSRQQQQQQQKTSFPGQQLLDYDDQDSDNDEYLANEYGSPQQNYGPGQGMNGHTNGHPNNNNGNVNDVHGKAVIEDEEESPILQNLTIQSPQSSQQRHSFVKLEQVNGMNLGDDDPWRDEDDESFVQGNNNNGSLANGQRAQQQEQPLKNLRPDSELDSFRRQDNQASRPAPGTPWNQEQYVRWMNRNLPETVDPVSDMTQSLRSGVVLVRLIEQLSGEQVDKRIPNATYTLQMLENLLTAFKFMDRVGVSTDGYTVKDIFNGNEEKIVQMFESIRAKFPHDAPIKVPTPPQQSLPPTPAAPVAQLQPQPPFAIQPPRGSPGPPPSRPQQQQQGKSPRIGHSNNGSPLPQQRVPTQNTGGSEYEALYDEAARSTIS